MKTDFKNCTPNPRVLEGATLTALPWIEYWHQGSISSFKIMCRDGKGFWHGVRWDGKTVALFPLGETDERKARKKLFEQPSGSV